LRCEHVFAAKNRFADQCAGDAVGYRVHSFSLNDPLPMS
jgi:hypothetical protein